MNGPDRSGSNAGSFWRFWFASTISNTGTGVTSVALPLVAVITLRASSFQVGLLVAASYASWAIIGLPAGVLVSRFPMRGTQVAMDLTRALALASIPLTAAFHVLSLAQLVSVAFLVGLCSVIFDVANSTFIVSIVSKEELVQRNSLVNASASAAQLAGPSLGGLLVQAVGGVTSILADTVSYVISATLLGSLPGSAADDTHRPAGQPAWRLIADGLRFVLRHRIMRPATVNVTIINFTAGAFMALTPIFLVRTLGARPVVVGFLYASEGVGALMGALVTPRLSRRLGTAGALRTGTIGAAALCCLMPLSPANAWGYLVFALGSAGFASGVVMVSIVTRSHRQVASPRELLPRVMATVRFVSWGIVPVGALVAGALASAISTRGAFWIACFSAVLAPVVLLVSPVRSLRELDQPESAAEAALT